MADEYDWNREARRVELYDSRYTFQRAARLRSSAVDDLVHEHDLTHGDVLAFSEYRDTESVIVSYNSRTKQYRLLENDDVSSAGYLTIPLSVMRNVTDFQAKYRSVIRDSAGVNFYISPSDVFLTRKFGDDVPLGWEIFVDFAHGGLENIVINGTWEGSEDDLGSITLDELKAFFNAKEKSAQSRLTVRVELRGERFEEYKRKYTKGKKTYSWLTAAPRLPVGWTVERGAGGGGSDSQHWDWHFDGPAETSDQVRSSISDFLEGFDFSFA